MFNVYAEEKDERKLANSFNNEVIARLYVIGFENYVAEKYPERDITLSIIEE